MHRVFSPIVVDRDVGFVSGRKGILPNFIFCEVRKLEGSGLVLSWVGGVSGGDVVLKVLASEDGRRPGDNERIEIVNCARNVIW